MKRLIGQIERDALIDACRDVHLGLRRILDSTTACEATRAYWDEWSLLHDFQKMLDRFEKEVHREE